MISLVRRHPFNMKIVSVLVLLFLAIDSDACLLRGCLLGTNLQHRFRNLLPPRPFLPPGFAERIQDVEQALAKANSRPRTRSPAKLADEVLREAAEDFALEARNLLEESETTEPGIFQDLTNVDFYA